MCYSGHCKFEGYLGGCKISSDINGFTEQYGYSPCLIGGYPTCPEDEEWIESHTELRENIIKQYYADHEVKPITVRRRNLNGIPDNN